MRTSIGTRLLCLFVFALTAAAQAVNYDIVYVRAPRRGDAVGTNWPEISNPVFLDAGADLMLLHPDGKEEVLVRGGEGSVTDPMVSFDGEWVFYSHFHDMKGGSVSPRKRFWIRSAA